MSFHVAKKDASKYNYIIVKKIFLISFLLFLSTNVFALRIGVRYLKYYLEENELQDNSTILLAEPDADDFNSSWHFLLKENDSDYLSYRKKWQECTKDQLQAIVDEQSTNGNLVIHYQNNLFYVGVNEQRVGKYSVNEYLSNYFEGKSYNLEKHKINGTKMYFAFIPVPENEKLIAKGILFQNIDGKIIPRLHFIKYHVYNQYPYESLVWINGADKDFYGYEIHFTKGTDAIVVSSYFDNGEKDDQDVYLEWKNNRFYEH